MKSSAHTKTSPTNSQELSEMIVQACKDAKGRDLCVLDVSQVFDLADHFIIISGDS